MPASLLYPPPLMLQNNWKPPKASLTLFADSLAADASYWTGMASADISTALSSAGLDSAALRTEAIEYFIA